MKYGRVGLLGVVCSSILPQVVMKWTGHSDCQAMKLYINIAEKTEANVMNDK